MRNLKKRLLVNGRDLVFKKEKVDQRFNLIALMWLHQAARMMQFDTTAKYNHNDEHIEKKY